MRTGGAGVGHTAESPVSAEMGDEMAEIKDELAAPEAAVQISAVTGSFPL